MKFTTSHFILTLLFALVISTPAMAYIPEQKPNEAFVIMGLSSSEAILEGKYEKAISLATSKAKLNKSAYDLSAEKLSLCVALLKTGKLDMATEACKSAKRIATKARSSDSSLTYYTKLHKFRNVLIDASEKNLALIEKIK